MWYPKKTPFWLRMLYPQLTWHKNRALPHIYLTFDDGPIPDVTEAVLNILRAYQVHATFFCVGENVNKHPHIFQRIVSDGHRVGNHTYHHVKGWNTSLQIYLKDVEACQQLVESNLFRPPHGRGTRQQYKHLSQYDIIMWDVMTGDFDATISPQQCLQNAIRYTENGSIIVFHDSIKARERLLYALPRAIEYWKRKGFTFKTL